MTPEYLEQLADLADPDKLWQLCGIAQLDLPEAKKNQLHTGVALRRYAHDMRMLNALEPGKSLCITPMGNSSRQTEIIDTPPRRRKVRTP